MNTKKNQEVGCRRLLAGPATVASTEGGAPPRWPDRRLAHTWLSGFAPGVFCGVLLIACIEGCQPESDTEERSGAGPANEKGQRP